MFRIIIGVLLFIAAILGGLYVALYLCLFGGLVQVINAAKATPIETLDLALGIVRVMCTGFAGWLTFFLGSLITGAFFAATSRSRY